MPFSGEHADHIYVSGLGFVSGRDPLHFVERDLRRSASSAGFCLLLLLLLPPVILWPVEIFSAVNRALLSAVFGSAVFSSVNELLRELREMSVSLLTWLIVLFSMRSMLKPPKQVSSSTVGGKRAILCSVLITVGITALAACCTDFLHDILEAVHLLELNPGSPIPSRPLAAAVYLIRIILLPAVFEEAVFRGCLLQTLRRHGDSFALFLSALCSGMIHYTVTGNLTGFVMSLIFGYFFLRTGSLKTVIFCHALSLTIPLLLNEMQSILQPVHYGVIQPLIMALLIAAGLVGFVLFCRWNHNAYILDDSQAASLTFRRKLYICLTGTTMLAASFFWLIQIFKNLQVLS